ncbi:MAG: hypothetical protein M5U01_19630 [Ardenticatenaceae bacterium]|nr:hypothetical protein [Ardenticatenaceae bacterium]
MAKRNLSELKGVVGIIYTLLALAVLGIFIVVINERSIFRHAQLPTTPATPNNVELTATFEATSKPLYTTEPITDFTLAASPTNMSSSSRTIPGSIRLWWSFLAGQYNLHIAILNKHITYIPERVDIFDPATKEAVGSFKLVEQPISGACSHLVADYALDGRVYWTNNGIDTSTGHFIINEELIFRVTLREPSNIVRLIDIAEMSGACESSTP